METHVKFTSSIVVALKMTINVAPVCRLPFVSDFIMATEKQTPPLKRTTHPSKNGMMYFFPLRGQRETDRHGCEQNIASR